MATRLVSLTTSFVLAEALERALNRLLGLAFLTVSEDLEDSEDVDCDGVLENPPGIMAELFTGAVVELPDGPDV